MAFKIFALACLVAVANAGVIAPVAHHVAPVQYAAPVAHYSAPIAQYSAPVAHYSAPVAHYSAPVAQYAAPVAHYAAPAIKVATPVHYAAPVEHYPDAPAEYNFEYSVHDEHTGDIKSQKEERHGDQVQGSYSLIEADGSRRIVEYTADAHNGFNAVVHREPSQHAVAYKPVVKVAAAPVLKVAAPVAHYAAPVAHYAAPAYQVAAPAYHGYAAPAQSYYHH